MNGIYNNMENEDSTKALYADPNACIQFTENQKSPPKKVVFSEPYECLPNFYLDNNFHKHDCDCVSKPKPQKDNCEKPQNPGFDFKSLLPLLTMFNKGGGGDLSSLTSILSQNLNSQNNPLGMLMPLLSNSGGLGNILNLFKPKQKTTPKPMKTTDFEIKNYTKVE